MVVAVTDVRGGRPLPLVPAGSVHMGPAAAMCEDEDGGTVFIWGMPVFSWDAGDVTGRRMAAVQLVKVAAAKSKEVAAGFAVDGSTLWRWRQCYEEGGADAIAALPKGPKGPSKLTEGKVAEIRSLRASGKSIAETASAAGVSPRSVAEVAKASAPATTPASSGTDLVPLARPTPRAPERQAARAGLLHGAAPVFTSGAALPLAGVLCILPALVGTGLMEAMEKAYATTRSAFYSARSLSLAFIFATLLGAGRAERCGRVDPVSMGRLLGLDRGPTANTLRRRFAELAEMKASGELWGQLAAHRLGRDGLPAGLVYIDGHVRAYHGKADLPKAHLARMRIAMAATEDAWLTDALGNAVLVWTPEPGSGLVGELRRAVSEVRSILGQDATFTVVFDRGGWSPATFAELHRFGVDILTYRKSPKPAEPASSFVAHEVKDEWGHAHRLELADRAVRIYYDQRRRYFACRQITRLDPATAHQTQILTTRTDPDPGPLAQAMFGRWSEENFFRYGRARFELDGLDSYAKVGDDPDRLVPNPAKRRAAAEIKTARAAIALAEGREGRAALEGVDATATVKDAFAAAHEHLESLEAAAKAIPAKVPLKDVHPKAARLDPERKRICDAIRISAYNAETTLARMLRPHFARAQDEARTLAQEIYVTPGDIEVLGDRLEVRLEPLSAPHRTRALSALCDELTASETTYPGTELTLVFSVKQL